MARDEKTHQPTPYLESLPDDLSTQDRVGPASLLAVAAQVGAARLIDNRILEAP